MQILILSLYYSPVNNIAATRVTYYADFLRSKGHEVKIITRHYSKNDLCTNSLEIGSKETAVSKYSYQKNGDIIETSFSKQNSILNKSKMIPRGFKGLYLQKKLDAYHHSYVENGLIAYDKEFSNTKFDFVIASSPPLATLILASEINKKYGVKWIADFRDSPLLDSHSGIVKSIRSKALKKVMQNISGIFFVSPGMKAHNEAALGKTIRRIPTEIVYNGFFRKDNEIIDENILKEFRDYSSNFDSVLTYTGSIYKERNLDFFLNRVKENEALNLGVVLVGIQDDFRSEIESAYSDLDILFISKTNYSTSTKIQELSDILLLTIWPNSYTGFSGKVFEYINACKPILLDHEPAQDLKDFLKEFNGVHCCNGDPNLFGQIILKIRKSQKPEINLDSIRKTSRQFQSEILLSFLEKLKS